MIQPFKASAAPLLQLGLFEWAGRAQWALELGRLRFSLLPLALGDISNVAWARGAVFPWLPGGPLKRGPTEKEIRASNRPYQLLLARVAIEDLAFGGAFDPQLFFGMILALPWQ